MTLLEEGEWLGAKRKDWRFQRLENSDKSMSEGGALKAADLHEGLDWGAHGKATIVDVGASKICRLEVLAFRQHLITNLGWAGTNPRHRLVAL